MTSATNILLCIIFDASFIIQKPLGFVNAFYIILKYLCIYHSIFVCFFWGFDSCRLYKDHIQNSPESLKQWIFCFQLLSNLSKILVVCIVCSSPISPEAGHRLYAQFPPEVLRIFHHVPAKRNDYQTISFFPSPFMAFLLLSV